MKNFLPSPTFTDVFARYTKPSTPLNYILKNIFMKNSYSHLTKAPAYNQISCFSRLFNRLVILPLTLPLCLVLVLGVGNVWGQTTTITITNATIGGSSVLATGTYNSGAERTWTQSSINFGGKAITCNNSNTPTGATACQYIQAQAANGVIYNTSALPGRIVSVKFTGTASVASSCFGGTSRLVNTTSADYNVGGTQIGTAQTNTTYTWNTDAATNYTFFCIKRGSTTQYLSSIEVTYESATSPAAPTISSITPGNQQLSVAFTAGSDGGSAITNYKYSTNGGTNWQTRASGTTASPLVISTLSTDGSTALTNGTSYNIQIRAVNAVGDGTATASSAATPRTTPSAPTITGITPGNQQLSVAFTAGSDGGSSITTYKYSTDGGANWQTRSAGTTASPLVISTLSTDGTTALTNGVSYDIQIRAVNAAGDGTASSTTSGTPVAPTSPTLNAVTLSSSLTSTYGTASTGVSFTASGSNLTGNITATAQSGYEVSTSLGSGYDASVSVASGTTVYVRFASTISAGDKNNATAVVLSGGGASSDANVTTSSSGNTVSQKALTVTDLSAENKIYDGLTTATATGTAALVGVVSPDAVSLTGTPTFTFVNATVGTSKTVNTTNYSLTGAQAANYTLTQPTLSANITVRSLTITANDVSKVQGVLLSEGAGSTAFTSSGLQNSETIGSVTIAYGTAGATTGDGNTVGVYASQVTPSVATGGTFTASNYSISYVAGSITVTQAPCGTEGFNNICTSSCSPANTSYGTRTWTGNNSVPWEATEARTDQPITGNAITMQTNGILRNTSSVSGGIASISFDYARVFTGNSTLKLFVNNTQYGSDITVSSTSATTFSTTVNLTGNIDIEIRNTGNRSIIDNISWTCYSAPEINIKQSSTNLANGSGTYSFGNDTLGGSSSAVTFTVENIGTETLNLTGTPKVAISGHTSDFTIDQTSTSATVSASDSTTFTVTFSPTTTGARSATISIANDDSNENPYTFTVTGTGATYAPSVTTSAATSISTTGATLNGEVTSDGGAAITERGFVYKTSSSVIISDNKTVVAGTTGTFSLSPTSLSVNTQYHFRAYAINSVNTTLGSELNFWTLANAPAAPTVNTPTGSSLNVTIGASDGNPSTTTYAIQETTSGNYVQANGSLGASAVWQTSSTWSAITVIGLSSATTYTFQVKARNGANSETAFGSTTSGTTSSIGLNSVILSSALTSTYGTASTGVSFTASGTNLTSNITATAQSGYQVSTDNSSFGASVSVASGTTVYVGFASTLSAGNYNNQIAVVLSGGGAAGNANVTTSSSSNTVSQKALSITTATIASKVYDGTTTSGTVTAGTLSGFIGSDTVVVASANGTYSDANGATGKTATITYTLGNGTNGGLATNYSLANTSATGDITQATQTITFSSFTTPITASTTIVASSNFGGTISYSSSNTNVATINSSTGVVTIVGNGTTTITASNAGNSNYTAASTSQVLTVNPVSGTIVTFPSSWSGITASAPSTSQNSNLSGTVTATRGAGLGSVTSGSRFNSNGWPSGSTLTLASNTDYLTFTLTASTGYVINLNNAVLSFGLSSSGTGPQAFGVYSSVNGFSSTSNQIGSDLSTASTSVTFPSSGFNDLSTIEIRIYAWNASQATGTGGFSSMSLTGSLSCTTPSQSSAISGSTTVCSGSAQTYSVTNVSGVGYNWVLPGGWSGSSTSNSISATVGSSGGNISVTPYNSATGCTNYAGTAQSVAVSVNASPTAPAATITQPTCSTATGTITITSQSDVEYSINGTDYQVSNVFSGLSPDTYTIYVKSTTTGNCVASTGSQVVTQPTIPTAPAASITQPTCSVATGTITITSQSNVEYSINGTDYQVSNVFSGLSPNTYTIYVESTTTGNCVASTGSQVVNAQPATPSAPTAGPVTQPTCSVTTGTFQINSYDPARTYSFTPSSGYIISGTGLVTALANSYTFTVDNAAGCTSPASSSQVVNAQPTIPTAPAATITQPTCSVATGTITINSQSNVEYSVDGSTYQVSNVFSGLSPNTYTIYVKSTTTGNCVASTGSQVVNAQPSVPTAPTASAQSLCSGSTVADLTVTSGSSIQWYDASTNGNLLAGGTSLTAGTYYASQTVSGCESTTRTSVAVTINSTGTWIGGASGNWNVAGNWCGGVPDQNTEVANIPSGVTVTVNNSPTILTYTLASGSTVNLGNNVITIADGGSFTNNGTFNAGTGTVAYAGAGTLDGSATTFNNLTVSGPLTVNTSPTINGILTINNGGSIITNPITYGPSATLVYNQGGAVSSTNYEWPTVNLPTNVTIQNASNVTINESKNINGILTLTSGDLILGANILTLGASASISSASSSSHIDATSSGEVRKIYNGNGSFTFPVGDGTNYTPATLNFTAGTSITGATDDYVGVRLKTSKVTGMNNTNQHYIKRAWFIEPGAGLSSYTYSVELSYCFADIEGTESEIRPVKRSFENSAYVWYYPGDVSFTDGIRLTGTTSAINTTDKVLLWSGLTSFSEFGGAGQGGLLPVELLFFNANAIENKVKLNWATSLEINNEKFEIERSADAVSFTKIATVSGGGNTTSLQDYAAFDEQPLSGWSYYRLKQIDFDQAFEYSNIASVYFEEGEFAIAVYPNPAKNSIMIQTFGDTKIYDAAIYNSLGQEIRKAEFNINMSIEDLASGTYTIKVIAGEKIIVKQIVKQ
jgi:hypothetical protein